MLKEFEGSTLQEKTENYMLFIGLSQTEIYNIKAIMFGEETISNQLTLKTNIQDVEDMISQTQEMVQLYTIKKKENL